MCRASGRARVLFDDAGVPCGVERLGVVLEPDGIVGEARRWAAASRIRGSRSFRASIATSWRTRRTAPSVRASRWPRLATWSSWERLGPVSFAYDPGLGADFQLYPEQGRDVLPGTRARPRRRAELRDAPSADVGPLVDPRRERRAAPAWPDRPATRDLGLLRARGRRSRPTSGPDPLSAAIGSSPSRAALGSRSRSGRDRADPRARGLAAPVPWRGRAVVADRVLQPKVRYAAGRPDPVPTTSRRVSGPLG